FWRTASVRRLDNGETELNATVDGQVKTIAEAFVMRHLKLADDDGISFLPTTKIFKQLALMGYVIDSDKLTFQNGHFFPQWRFLIHTILHCLSPKETSWEQFSSNIAIAIICLATDKSMKRESRGFSRVKTTLFPTMLVTEQVSHGEGPTSPVGTIIIESSPYLQNISITYRKTMTKTGRIGIRIPQSNVPSSVVDDAITKEMHDGMGRATATAFSLAIEQGSGNISKTQTKATPYGSCSPRTSSEGDLGCHFTMGIILFRLGLKGCQTYPMNHLSEKKFSFSSVKSASTPMEIHKPLSKDADGTDIDFYLYRFQVQPKVSHMHAVKRIFRYLKGQPTLGLWYPKDSPLELIAYSDSDYAGASLDRKSTTGGCQFLGSRLISWQCKKQTIVANSTTEAKYITASNCCGQVHWL
nr:ribonuclease H-like domain, reverse transcriptase, RNA-dependent DNA polymerase [Tanacetum cinerariifolium]